MRQQIMADILITNADARKYWLPSQKVIEHRRPLSRGGITHAGITAADDAMPAMQRANDDPSHPASPGPTPGTADIQMHSVPGRDYGREG